MLVGGQGSRQATLLSNPIMCGRRCIAISRRQSYHHRKGRHPRHHIPKKEEEEEEEEEEKEEKEEEEKEGLFVHSSSVLVIMEGLEVMPSLLPRL